MGAPLVLFDEAACLTALREFLLAVVSPPAGPVPALAVYRSRPAAVAGVRGLAVYYQPTTPVPVDDSYQGEEHVSLQRQRTRVTVDAVAPVSTVTVFGQPASYVLQLGDGVADVAAGLLAAVLAVLPALPVTGVVVNPPPSPTTAAFDLTADLAGASMNVQPVLGNLSVQVLDDCRRNAAYNWSSWTVTIVCQDVSDAAGNNRAVGLAERVRRFLQAESVPVVDGFAYPYLRDRLAEGGMAYEQVLGPPRTMDSVEDGVWVRRVALDVVFRPLTGLTHDVPSLDEVGIRTTTFEDPPAA